MSNTCFSEHKLFDGIFLWNKIHTEWEKDFWIESLFFLFFLEAIFIYCEVDFRVLFPNLSIRNFFACYCLMNFIITLYSSFRLLIQWRRNLISFSWKANFNSNFRLQFSQRSPHKTAPRYFKLDIGKAFDITVLQSF